MVCLESSRATMPVASEVAVLLLVLSVLIIPGTRKDGEKYFANSMIVVTLFAVTWGQMFPLQVSSVPGT